MIRKWELGAADQSRYSGACKPNQQFDNSSIEPSPVETHWAPGEDWDSLILGENLAVRQLAQHIARVADAACTVLVSGETGTGKEVWSNQIHRLGSRADKPFVPVNCAALTSTLAESQLFGHQKGAFTGADTDVLGAFRAAEGGVLFLDEVGEMPLELQPKLLRVLQEQEITPVGASAPIKVNVQVVAATNRNLKEEVARGRFREDLYFRLNLVELKVPALRKRAEDIPRFIEFFSQKYAQKYSKPVWMPDASAIKQFCSYHWPGNIRQLSHVIEQAYVLDHQPTLPSSDTTDSLQGDLPQVGANRIASAANPRPQVLPFYNLDRLREIAVEQALQATGGHKGKAAELLGIHANTLTRLLAQMK